MMRYVLKKPLNDDIVTNVKIGKFLVEIKIKWDH